MKSQSLNELISASEGVANEDKAKILARMEEVRKQIESNNSVIRDYAASNVQLNNELGLLSKGFDAAHVSGYWDGITVGPHYVPRAQHDAYFSLRRFDRAFSDLRIRMEPTGIPLLFNITELLASNLHIQSFPEEVFQFPVLKKLDLSKNKIKNIPSLDSLESLKVLIIGGNPIDYDDPATKSSLERLAKQGVYILDGVIQMKKGWERYERFVKKNVADAYNSMQDIISNCEASIQDVCGTSHSRLSYISLSSDKLEDVPDALFELATLEKINLEKTTIKHLKSFSPFKSLKTVYLPPTVDSCDTATMKAVKELEQKGVHVMVSFGDRTSKRIGRGEYDCYFALQKYNPKVVVNESKITRVLLRDNTFKAIPPELAQLHNLYILDLGGNSIDDISGLCAVADSNKNLKRIYLKNVSLNSQESRQVMQTLAEKGVKVYA
jgi:Leucine-rich repeat (LRR) protein